MNKKIFFTTFALVIGLAIGAAFAAVQSGNLPLTVGNPVGYAQVPIQNIKGVAPAKGKSYCTTVTGTNAVQVAYSTAGYSYVKANAFNPTTGASVNVMQEEDDVQVWSGSEYEGVNNQGKSFRKLTMKDYSSASHSTRFCFRPQ